MKYKIVIKVSLIILICLLAGIGMSAYFIASLFKKQDFSQIPPYYPFKSEIAKEKYYEYYDKRAAEWPVRSETLYVDTSFGKSFVRISGPAGAPPLVLMPSVSASSLIWIPNVKSLSENFRVYAVDNIYDVGRSVNSRPISSVEDLTRWMDELFTALKLGNNINLMGLSFGGWLTSRYALAYPHRLNRIVLVAPVATVLPIPGEWAWRGILSAIPHRYFMKRFMVDWACQDLVRKKDAASMSLVKKIMDDAMMGLECYTFRMPVTPTVLTDAELKSFKMPVLFLVGEHEVLYPAREAIRRLNRVAPAIKTEVIGDASHDLTSSQPQLVDDRVKLFLQ